ncbi:MAG: pseudouridine-5'-phosphate glycosidase [Planctomycetota bacterium]
MPNSDRSWFVNRIHGRTVALESTILTHGLPRDAAQSLADQTHTALENYGIKPAIVGIINHAAIVGLTSGELERMLTAGDVHKVNSSNLGLALHQGWIGATTVSVTVELAARAGISVFATGGIGGVHHGYHQRLDISSDLAAIARHPVAVVASGCKNILDLASTRELLETLGIPVVGYRCDLFPAFYQRGSEASVDARFDDPAELADYVRFELRRTGRGLLVANPIPQEHEIPVDQWTAWLAEAENRTRDATGRDATPALLAAVHAVSSGKTTDANLALALANADLAGRIVAQLSAE